MERSNFNPKMFCGSCLQLHMIQTPSLSPKSRSKLAKATYVSY